MKRGSRFGALKGQRLSRERSRPKAVASAAVKKRALNVVDRMKEQGF